MRQQIAHLITQLLLCFVVVSVTVDLRLTYP